MSEIAPELVERFRKLMASANPLPWEYDVEPNEDGEYGPGPDPSTGYDDFMILGSQGGKILGTENATHKLIEEDRADEDGYAPAWDAYGKANAELLVEAVNALPRMLALVARFSDFDDLVDIVRPACLTTAQAGQVARLLMAAGAKELEAARLSPMDGRE